MKKIRVLYVIPSFGTGGAERLVLDMLQYINKKEFQPLALSLYPQLGGPFEREIEKKKLPVIFLKKHKGPDLKIVLDINRVIRFFKPHVLHSHLHTLYYTLIPACFNKVPVCIHTVHSAPRYEVHRLGKIFHWFAFRLGKVVSVSVSRAVAEELHHIYGKKLKTKVIYCGISTSKFFYEPTFTTNRQNPYLTIIHVGSFTPVKNHKLLIEAFSQIEHFIPNVSLWLVGDGMERPKIEKLVENMHLKEKVRFLGVRDDIPDLLRQSDIFVLCSNSEAFPLSVLEAMAAGVPVVATAVGGIPEAVVDGKTGILVPPNNSQALAVAILRLAADIHLRQKMGEAARKRAIEFFDIKLTIREYEALYKETL